MKKSSTIIWLLMIGLISVSFYSCSPEHKEFKKEQKEEYKKEKVELNNQLRQSQFQEGYHVIIIDSCEYIVYHEYTAATAGYGYMAHKGNCKFCEERRKKELEK